MGLNSDGWSGGRVCLTVLLLLIFLGLVGRLIGFPLALLWDHQHDAIGLSEAAHRPEYIAKPQRSLHGNAAV